MDIEENTNEQFHGIIEPVEIDHEMRTAPSPMSGTDSSPCSGACFSEWTASA